MSRILLIDDDSVVLLANREALQAAKHEVATASSVAEGLGAAASFAPDVVVLEGMFDGTMAGFELCHELARRYPRIPLIVLTRADDHTGAAALRDQDRDGGWIPAQLYLEKPVTPALLLDQVEHVLEGNL